MKAFLCLLLSLGPALAVPGPADKSSPVGKKVEAFKLRDYRGAERSLSDFADRKLMVVAFLGAECPLAKLYGPRLAELAKQYETKGVAFVGINSNQQDSITAIGQYAKTHGLSFPILKDVGNVVADQFGATRTPEVFVLDKERVIRYWGRIDDQFGIGFARLRPEHRDLVQAVEELLAGKQVSKPVTEAPGCFIGRVHKTPSAGAITYSKHIAPILNQRCVECHRAGQVAPFALTSYKEVVGWTETIEEVLREGRMPPWQADPRYGEFSNDCRVPDAEKQLVYDWIKSGAPEGDRKDLPPPPQFAKGWRIPEPDLVIKMPKPFRVPADGEVPYQFIVVDPGFKEDKWVKAAEVRPGAPSVVHHVLVFVQPPGGGTDKYGGFAANWIAAIAPNSPPTVLPEGTAKFIPAGSRFLFQIHYTTNGSEQTDQTAMGLVFADPKSVKKEVSTEMAANNRIEIPPHDPNYRVDAKYLVREDSLLLNLMPHTHVRGKAFKYEAKYPDGKQEVILDVPHYDFNWQNSYILAKPKRLPKGTEIHCTAYYDNSKNNKSNPNPDETVHWGDQTWEEMMIGYFNVMPAEQDLQINPRPASKPVVMEKPPLDAELKKLTRQALKSEESFDAFATALHEKMPKVDRVCLTTISGGNLTVEFASYPGKVEKQVATAGFETNSRAYALAYFCLVGNVTEIPDLKQSHGVDMNLLSQTLGSSFHVPVALEGKPGTVNFWSKEKGAFTSKEVRPVLRALVEVMAGRD
jgi:peroxiredoxin